MPRRSNKELFRDYGVELTGDEKSKVKEALDILERKFRKAGVALSSPTLVSDYLKLQLGAKQREEFLCIFLDSQNRLIETRTMFVGTLAQTSVHPREIVKTVLELNAAAVIFSHCHPSGVSESSRADELLTATLKETLKLVDCRVLDHIIVAGAAKPMSFAERGLLEPTRCYNAHKEPAHYVKPPQFSA